MQLPDALVKALTTLYEKKKEEFEKQSHQNSATMFNHIVGIRWRVDVTISSSIMTRVFKPAIVMQMELSNGNFKTFEITFDKFHELRLQVATVLNEMNIVESHPMMKIE